MRRPPYAWRNFGSLEVAVDLTDSTAPIGLGSDDGGMTWPERADLLRLVALIAEALALTEEDE